ncbi:hypothetical protein FJ251_09435 [bacterium]|nr:hypothetical protein [bacterium]
MSETTDLREIVFVILLVLGVLAIVAGLVQARRSWRGDQEPYGRAMRKLDVLRRPERYAQDRAVSGIRLLTRFGSLLLAAAVILLLFKLLAR